MAIVVSSACATSQAADDFAVPTSAASVLNQYCMDCHGGDSAEGGVRFDSLASVKLDERLELLNKAQEQLLFKRIQLTASITNTPIRKLRFFREFFGYPKMLSIFKDNKRFGGNYDNAKGRLVGECDRLVDHILQKDQNVFEELLTTEDFYVYHSGDNEAMTAASNRIRRIYEYFKDTDWQNFKQEDLLKHKEFLAEVKMRGVDVNQLATKGRRNSLREFKTAMTSFTLRFDDGETAAAPFVSFPAHGPYNASTRTGLQLRLPEVAKFFNIKLDIAGRYIRLPYHGTEGHKTIGNWYTTLLNAHGNPIEHYGDLDLEMSRKKLDQTGAIEQLMS